MLAATQQQLNEKAAEFDAKISALWDQIHGLNRQSAELNSRDRVMDLETDVQNVGDAAKRVLTDDRPDFEERVKLIAKNGAAQIKLVNGVLDNLPAAANALASGDKGAQAKVQAQLNQATGGYADSANERAALKPMLWGCTT